MDGDTGAGRTADGVAPGASSGLDLGRLAAVEVDLAAVEQALVAIDEGTWGTCSTCGSVIDHADPATRPTALTCAAHG